MTTPLIISADDYAQGESIDHGILDLIQQKRLTATSCLSMSPRWKEAASAITSTIRQQADIGLHLDFTLYGYPLRHTHPQLVIRSLLRSLNKQDIRSSIATQLDAFEHELGSAPDYIDGHQHVHQLPQIREALLKELQARYADKLPWIRISAPLYAGSKGKLINALGASRMKTLAHKNGFRTTDILLGVYEFGDVSATYSHRTQRWLETAVDEAKRGHIAALMCHPGSSSNDNTDPIQHARPIEYQVLSSQTFSLAMNSLDIHLQKGSQLLKYERQHV